MTLDQLRRQIVTINGERCVMLALPVLTARLGGAERVEVRLLSSEGEPVPDEVLRSVLDLVEREAQVAEAAHEALWLHYQREVHELRRVMDPAFRDVDAPLLADRSELSRLAVLRTVYAHEAAVGEEGGDFGLVFSATWEQEHGVGVRFLGGRAAGVGGEEYAFESRSWVEHSIAERLGDVPCSRAEARPPSIPIEHARRGGRILLFAGVVLVVVIVGIVRRCLGS